MQSLLASQQYPDCCYYGDNNLDCQTLSWHSEPWVAPGARPNEPSPLVVPSR